MTAAAEPDATAPDRLIALEGAVNFRDLGGYDAGGGMRTRWRTLFRADGLGDLTEADFATMRGLGIRTVIDLRSAEELERGRFDVDAHPVTFHHFPIIERLPDAEAFDKQPGLLGTQYLDMVRVFVRHVETHPQSAQVFYAIEAVNAFVAAYPCKKS